MQGKIIKGIAGFYYVHVADCGVYECMAKGIFRNRKIRPLVGDDVIVEPVEDTEIGKKGNIIDVLPRHNMLIRPAVANIDQALLVFSVKFPKPNLNLLSRFLIAMSVQDIPAVVCFNKTDQTKTEETEHLAAVFEKSGCRILRCSVKNGEGIEKVAEVLMGKTTALAGPSGTGKSSLLNAISPKAASRTGAISEKINRGRHTTRHTEIFHISGQTYIMDTPGFTSFDAIDIDADRLRLHFPELSSMEGQCRFHGCVHINEPDCAVKDAVECGKISRIRYEIYRVLYQELKDKRKYT